MLGQSGCLAFGSASKGLSSQRDLISNADGQNNVPRVGRATQRIHSCQSISELVWNQSQGPWEEGGGT